MMTLGKAAPRTIASIAAALVLVSGGPVDAAPAQVSVKAFARKPDFESAKLSPTGKYLAVAIPEGDQTMLGVIELKTRKLSAAMRFAGGEHVYDYWWVGAERVVSSIASRGGPLDQPHPTGELFAMNADGGQRKYLFGYRGEQQVGSHLQKVVGERGSAYMLDPLPREAGEALIATVPWDSADVRNVRLERIDVHTGRRRVVSMVEGYAPLGVAADGAGRLRLAFSSDVKSRYHLYAPADDQASSWKELSPSLGPLESVELHGATPDGEAVFLTVTETGGRVCLHEYRAAKAVLHERVCKAAGAVGRPLFSLDGATLIGLAYEAGVPRMEFLDSGHSDAALLQSLAKAFGGQRVSITSATLDAKKAVLLVDSDRNPGDYYLLDRDTKKADYLMSVRPWIDPAAMTSVAPFSYAARDGVTLHGYLTARGGTATRKAPLVLLPHGGPHGVRDWWHWSGWPQLLAHHGYAVLQVDYRGSGGYGDAHERAGYRNWGTLMQDDLTDAVRWAIKQGVADPARICILGASYGGYAALMSPMREPDLYRCAIGLSGIYDLAEWARETDAADSLMGRNYLKEVLGSEALMREQSPISHVEKLRIPVLIAHGTSDRRVPFRQATALRKALLSHGKEFEWMEFGGEEHGFHVDANHEAFLSGVLEFLDRHIGSAASKAAAQ